MDVARAFDDRLQEIESYLSFLESLEAEIGANGPPALAGRVVTPLDQQILYSAVYLQLYNLVEATATWCIEAVANAAANSRWFPADLSDNLKKEWVRHLARTNIELNADHRLVAALNLCNHLIANLPMMAWEIDPGGGGNWDEHLLAEITKRLGFQLTISWSVEQGIKRFVREDQGALKLVKLLRNRLAHGAISFSDCGANDTVSDLKDIKDRIVNYLREVVQSFLIFINDHQFLHPARRPARGGET